jgi:predicted transcriptional regulator
VRRQPIEIYIDMLKLLHKKGAMKITHITQVLNLNGSLAKEYIDFMLKQNLIEKEAVSEKRAVYKITTRGITILRYFREIRDATPQEVWSVQEVRQRK